MFRSDGLRGGSGFLGQTSTQILAAGQTKARYRRLETIRDYAANRLAASGEVAATRSCHRDHYLAFAEEAEAHLEGPGQTVWMDLVAGDYPNLRAALA